MKKLFKSKFLLVTILIVVFLIIQNIATSRSFIKKVQAATQCIIITSTPESGKKSLQLNTFWCITVTPSPTSTPRPSSTPTLLPNATNQAATATPGNTLPPVTPPPAGKQYCVDEDPGGVTIESCDDSTRCDVAHGGGGVAGPTCGPVINWEHTIIESMLSSTGSFNNTLSDNLSIAVISNCHTAPPYSPYISTFNVIDSYNLAGFPEFSRGTLALASSLVSAWGSTPGYTLSASAQGATPGDAVLFGNPAHTAILNTIEVDDRGNGDIWFLHTNAAYYLGKLMVANYQVVASSTGDTNVTFGSRSSKGPDATTGETVCYCGSGSVCYRYVF